MAAHPHSLVSSGPGLLAAGQVRSGTAGRATVSSMPAPGGERGVQCRASDNFPALSRDAPQALGSCCRDGPARQAALGLTPSGLRKKAYSPKGMLVCKMNFQCVAHRRSLIVVNK